MATMAAAVMAKAQREVRKHFEEKGAFDRGQAIAYDAPDLIHQRQLEVLIRRGIIVDAGDGRYWLDRDAIRREERMQSVAWKVVLAVAAGVLLLGGLVALAKSF